MDCSCIRIHIHGSYLKIILEKIDKLSDATSIPIYQRLMFEIVIKCIEIEIEIEDIQSSHPILKINSDSFKISIIPHA